MLIFYGFLKHAGMQRTLVRKTKAHRLVTRELLHWTPSHGVPQGSSVFPQLGGVFCHCVISESRAATAGGAEEQLLISRSC